MFRITVRSQDGDEITGYFREPTEESILEWLADSGVHENYYYDAKFVVLAAFMSTSHSAVHRTGNDKFYATVEKVKLY